MKKIYLPDTNIWLALTFDSHVHHPAAKSWFNGLKETCFFCRMTQQGLLRLSTNQAAFGRHALRLADAWRNYDAFRADPRVDFALEPADMELPWRGLRSINHSRLKSGMTHTWPLSLRPRGSSWSVLTRDSCSSLTWTSRSFRKTSPPKKPRSGRETFAIGLCSS